MSEAKQSRATFKTENEARALLLAALARSFIRQLGIWWGYALPQTKTPESRADPARFLVGQRMVA